MLLSGIPLAASLSVRIVSVAKQSHVSAQVSQRGRSGTNASRAPGSSCHDQGQHEALQGSKGDFSSPLLVCFCPFFATKLMQSYHSLLQDLLRTLNARQLAIKYLSNVTYGYTSASFSGRMPCCDIADSIVETGRETLQRVSMTFSRCLFFFCIYSYVRQFFVFFLARQFDSSIRLLNGVPASFMATLTGGFPLLLDYGMKIRRS
jgi:hypothetical protein